jgi:hypothetical protein
MIRKIGLLIALLISSIAHIYAQTIVKGRVTDAATGMPMPFVTVIIKGTVEGINTDVNGEYALQTHENANQIEFSFLGYITATRQLKVGEAQTLNIALMEDKRMLDEVVVSRKKEKYRNKNNPAVELIRKVIANKDKNRMSSYDYVSYTEYEKMQLAISNTPNSIKKNPLFKKYQFVLDNVDTTRFAGKALLPLYLEENIADKYLRKTPEKKKTVVKATKRVNFDERFINNESISAYMKNLYQDVDIYENNLYILTNSFLSPIADMSPSFYKFFITDTVSAAGVKLVELSFLPRNKNDFLFTGKLYVTLDGNYAVQKADLDVGKDVNLNWVTSLKLSLDFEKSTDGRFHLSKSNILVNFGVFQGKSGLFGERTLTVKNFDIVTKPADSVFQGSEVVMADSFSTKSDSYWQENRPEALTESEAKTYTNMDSLSKMKSFKRIIDWGSMFIAGYKMLGPVEIGPVSTFYSFNPVEGFRLRFGGRTTPYLSKRYFFESYGAYGFKDHRWKFFLAGTYSINNKSIYSYPLNYIRASFQRDVKIPGQELKWIQEDNFLLSFKRGLNDKYLYNDLFKLEYVVEFGNHMAIRADFSRLKQEAAGGLSFMKNDGLNEKIKEVTTSSFGLEWRWAPNEQFFQRKLFRTPIPNPYPIFTLRADLGLKDVVGGEYDFQAYKGEIYKRVYLSQFGLADVIVGGGYIVGQVPFPLLSIARANQTYAYQLPSYNLMNFLEFVSDRYVNVHVDYHMYGFIFNKIPLFKKLKLREVASFKLLYGGIRDENRPENNSEQFIFPKDKYGTSTTFSLEKQPYMEGSVGIENLFNLIRLDVVKRFTYLDHPYVAKWGIRARVNFDF